MAGGATRSRGGTRFGRRPNVTLVACAVANRARILGGMNVARPPASSAAAPDGEVAARGVPSGEDLAAELAALERPPEEQAYEPPPPLAAPPEGWLGTYATLAVGTEPLTEADLEAELRRLEASGSGPMVAPAATGPVPAEPPAPEPVGPEVATPAAMPESGDETTGAAPDESGTGRRGVWEPPSVGPGSEWLWIRWWTWGPGTRRRWRLWRARRAAAKGDRPVGARVGAAVGAVVPWGVATQALLLAVVSRVVLGLVVWLSLRVYPRLGSYPTQLPDSFFPDRLALDGWARWDAAHYVAIAAGGYGGDNPSPHGGVGFFPLFPLLMRGAIEAVGAAPTPANLALAGIVVANLCFLAAVPLVARIGAACFGEEAGRNAAVLLCVAPFGFFFNAAYSESLFLLLALLALWSGAEGRWWAAGLAAGLASATRLVGLALWPALLVMAVRRRASVAETATVGVLAPAGTAAYLGYGAWALDDPLAYFRAQATWGGWEEHVRFYAELFVRHPVRALTGDPRHLVIVLNVVVALVCLALLPRVWRSLDPGIALFTTLLVVVQAAFTWVSLGRYLLPAVGVYLVAGALLARPRWSGWVRDGVVIGCALLLAVLGVLYGHGFWVV